MSSTPSVRTLRIPPGNYNGLKIPRTLQRARKCFRVHQSRHPAMHFSVNAAHRFSQQDCPHPCLYLAVDIATCLFERFGDKAYDRQKAVAQALWSAHSVSAIRVPELHVCDLTNAKTLSAMMVDLSSLMHNDVVVSQEWGFAIQRHPANFQAINFKSRFSGKACLAVIERDGLEMRLRPALLGELSDNDTAVDWLDKHKVSLY